MMQTERDGVLLRDFRLEDVENKVRWINDPANNRYLHYDLPLELEKTRHWFLNKDRDRRLDLVIEYQGVPVGVIGLIGIDRALGSAEYYITLGEPGYQRRGIAYTASSLLLEYGFKTLGLRQIWLNVDDDNTAACGLYEKLGFRCEEIRRGAMLRRGVPIDRRHYVILNTKE